MNYQKKGLKTLIHLIIEKKCYTFFTQENHLLRFGTEPFSLYIKTTGSDFNKQKRRRFF